MNKDWDSKEIDAVVRAYFWMLGEQVSGNEFSKKQVVARLQFVDLAARNRSAIERKLSNISAILDEIGAPWIRGFKPLSHFQKALRDRVLAVARSRGIPVDG
jgi:hypothetical protein